MLVLNVGLAQDFSNVIRFRFCKKHTFGIGKGSNGSLCSTFLFDFVKLNSLPQVKIFFVRMAGHSNTLEIENNEILECFRKLNYSVLNWLLRLAANLPVTVVVLYFFWCNCSCQCVFIPGNLMPGDSFE